MTDPDRIVDKIRKLLALSESSNEHEAALAAERAQHLLLRHGLDLAAVTTEAVGVEETRILGSTAPWQQYLADSVATAMGGRALFSGRPKARLDELKPQIHFYGLTGTAEGMAHLYRHLEVQLEVMADVATATRTETWINARTFRRSFLLGAVDTIGTRLQRRKTEMTGSIGDSTALVRMTTVVDHAIQERVGKVGTARPPAEPDWVSFSSGNQAGSAVDLGDARITQRRALPRGN